MESELSCIEQLIGIKDKVESIQMEGPETSSDLFCYMQETRGLLICFSNNDYCDQQTAKMIGYCLQYLEESINRLKRGLTFGSAFLLKSIISMFLRNVPEEVMAECLGQT
ncbi:hypothetical protein EFB08_06540 [Rufibacter latericius]|uniref:Uncharacterized protein n=1 Tax=Rufibacter latericius TaxID=2487040 RepID=A0A3M9MU86_9BACT|nr:hypothetical protein EFB08_06540 [Rufibacter latericius]